MTIEMVDDPLTRSTERVSTDGLASLFAPKQRDGLAEFREQSRSLAVASQIYENKNILKRMFPSEVGAEGDWTEPAGIKQKLIALIYSAANLPGWNKPSPQRVQNYLKDSIIFSDPSKSSLVTVSFRSQDIKLGMEILNLVFFQTDAALKDQSLKDVDEKISYLQQRLHSAEVVEYKNVISDVLIKSELKRIMLQSKQPSIVAIVDPPTVSERPVSPQPFLVLPLSGIAGCLIGFFTFLFFGDLGRRSSKSVRSH